MSWFVFLFICCPHYYDSTRGFAPARHTPSEFAFHYDGTTVMLAHETESAPLSASSIPFISIVHIQTLHTYECVRRRARIRAHISVKRQILFRHFFFSLTFRCYHSRYGVMFDVPISVGVRFTSFFSLICALDGTAYTHTDTPLVVPRCHVDGIKRIKTT